MSSFPDYYALLNIPRTATADDVRHAYKRESLRTHPDRLAKASDAEKTRATEKFQAVADAYYVLSDPVRRREYDALYASRPRADASANPDASSTNTFFNTFASMFGAASAGADPKAADAGADTAGVHAERPDPEYVFADVFEEMLRPEVERHVNFWTYVGAASGAGLGFIIANLPGLMLGAYGGKRLGAIRDAKGKSVAAVFSQLGGNQKAEILRALAIKILGSAM